jgi:signal peptidase I
MVIDDQPATAAPDADAKRGGNTFWRELPILLAVAIVVAVVVRAFVLQTFYIPSESMQNTLEINDRVLVNKLVYDFRSPHRGEIVVFRAPASWRNNPAEEDFIKRVIGVGGDHVICCDAQHRIVVNGHALDEPYIYHDNDGVFDPASDEDFDVTVPAGRLWVMGDHRLASGDSRQQYKQTKQVEASTIAEDAVVGRAFVVFWPLSRAKWLTVPKTFDEVPDAPRR